MKACRECELPLVARQDDGTGKHIACPPAPSDGRQRYLDEKARTMPRLNYHVERLQELDGTPAENLEQIRRELEEQGL